MRLPPACPEIPVRSLEQAIAYYRDKMAFTLDWADQESGLAGVSQGECRLFISTESFRGPSAVPSPVVIWLNLTSRADVDQLFEQWSRAGVAIASPPSAKSFKLYEFFAHDGDNNVFRVFYDFAWEGVGETP